ncbi:hypothetical protein DFS34DRAFT_653839 [Phlyctochytrium arcticum]|nr:hypothetical protein DFS34DRAFT_653839 [Phlyctochytrium arcticum]
MDAIEMGEKSMKIDEEFEVASDAQIRRAGRWNKQMMETCYLAALSMEVLRELVCYNRKEAKDEHGHMSRIQQRLTMTEIWYNLRKTKNNIPTVHDFGKFDPWHLLVYEETLNSDYDPQNPCKYLNASFQLTKLPNTEECPVEIVVDPRVLLPTIDAGVQPLLYTGVVYFDLSVRKATRKIFADSFDGKIILKDLLAKEKLVDIFLLEGEDQLEGAFSVGSSGFSRRTFEPGTTHSIRGRREGEPDEEISFPHIKDIFKVRRDFKIVDRKLPLQLDPKVIVPPKNILLISWLLNIYAKHHTKRLTSPNSRAILGITAHWVDDKYNLRSLVVGAGLIGLEMSRRFIVSLFMQEAINTIEMGENPMKIDEEFAITEIEAENDHGHQYMRRTKYQGAVNFVVGHTASSGFLSSDTALLVLEVKQGKTFADSEAQVYAQAASSLSTRISGGRGLAAEDRRVYHIRTNAKTVGIRSDVQRGGRPAASYEKRYSAFEIHKICGEPVRGQRDIGLASVPAKSGSGLQSQSSDVPIRRGWPIPSHQAFYLADNQKISEMSVLHEMKRKLSYIIVMQYNTDPGFLWTNLADPPDGKKIV